MQKFCPRKESKQIIILTSLNLLKKPQSANQKNKNHVEDAASKDQLISE